MEKGLSRKDLALVYGLALGVRLLALLLAERAELIAGLFLDSAAYAKSAAAIRAGGGASDGPYLLSPLYPYFLALFPTPEGDPRAALWIAPRVAQAFLGAGTALCSALIGARLGGRAVGLLAGCAAAVCGVLVHGDGALLAEPLQGFGLTLGVALLLGSAAVEHFPYGRYLGAGIALGVAAAAKPNALLVACACAVVLARESRIARSWKCAGIFALGVLLAVAPFSLRNLVVASEPVLLSANGGFNFWVGNHAGAPGVFDAPKGYVFDVDPVGANLARAELGAEASYAEASSWWRERACDDIAADPIGWLGLLGRKALYFLHPREIPQLGAGFEWMREELWILGSPLDARTILLLAALAPLVALAWSEERARASLALPLAAVTAHAASVVLFFVTGRFRSPILPLAIALASFSVVGLLRILVVGGGRRPLALCALGALALACAVLIPVHRGPLAVNALQGIEELHMAQSLAARGHAFDSLAWFERSLERADSMTTRLAHADALRSAGKSLEAEGEYRAVIAREPANAYAWYWLGVVFWEDRRNAAGAQNAFERAIAADPALADAHFNLGVVLLNLQRFAEAKAALRRALELARADAAWRGDAERALETLGR